MILSSNLLGKQLVEFWNLKLGSLQEIKGQRSLQEIKGQRSLQEMTNKYDHHKQSTWITHGAVLTVGLLAGFAFGRRGRVGNVVKVAHATRAMPKPAPASAFVLKEDLYKID
jgi:hypothetical protein